MVGWRTDQDRAGAPVPIQDEVLIESRAPCPGHLLQPCCLSSTTFANALYKTYLLNSCAPCRRTTSKELCKRESRNKSESRTSDSQAAKNFNTSRQVLTATPLPCKMLATDVAKSKSFLFCMHYHPYYVCTQLTRGHHV